MIKKVGCDIECAPRIALGTHDDQVVFGGWESLAQIARIHVRFDPLKVQIRAH